MGKKRLCLVIPSLQAGGMERVMSELAGYFSTKKNIEIYLILYGITREVFYHLPDEIIIYKPLFKFNNRWRLVNTLRTLFFLRSTIKGIKPNSILSFGEYWNSLVLLAFFGLPYPVYISDRCSPAKRYSTFHSFLRKWLYPRAKGIVSQTEKAKQFYQGQFRNDNLIVIGNPIHLLSNNDLPKKNIVLSVGRLIESKNHNKLIELFCQINNPGWKLIIVGGNALKQDNLSRLKDLITSLDAESKVVLTGYLNDLSIFYQESSIFALTSVSEGFPNVIGEAMSAGLPAVSFDCIAGPSEMITDGEDGYLIPVNDYILFQERLEKLMGDEPLRTKMGAKARKSIQKFSVENIGGKFNDFILGK